MSIQFNLKAEDINGFLEQNGFDVHGERVLDSISVVPYCKTPDESEVIADADLVGREKIYLIANLSREGEEVMPSLVEIGEQVFDICDFREYRELMMNNQLVAPVKHSLNSSWSVYRASLEIAALEKFIADKNFKISGAHQFTNGYKNSVARNLAEGRIRELGDEIREARARMKQLNVIIKENEEPTA